MIISPIPRADPNAKPQLDWAATPSLEGHRLQAYSAIVAGDVGIVFIAVALAAYFVPHEAGTGAAVFDTGRVLALIYLTMMLYSGAVGRRALSDWLQGARLALGAWAASCSLLVAIALAAEPALMLQEAAWRAALPHCAAALLFAPLVAAWRRTFALALGFFWGARVVNDLVIEDGGTAFSLPGAIPLCAKKHALDPASRDPVMLDRLGRLFSGKDRVIVTCARERRRDWAFQLRAAGVHGEIVTAPLHAIGCLGVAQYEDAGQRGGHSTLVVSDGPLGIGARLAKRLFDIVFAGLALLLLAPFLAALALAIRLQDGGPALFIQPRVGQGNRAFNLLKFRSMEPARCDREGVLSTQRGDKRITAIGSWMRRTSVDELPQLINVLRGDMSIVGPRPHALGSRADAKLFWEIDGDYWHRHSLKPGLTGLAQVRGFRGATCCEADLQYRLRSDLEYIEGWSLFGDCMIIARTAFVLTHPNAY